MGGRVGDIAIVIVQTPRHRSLEATPIVVDGTMYLITPMGRIVVTVRERTPSLGQPVTAKVTYPFRLITVPRSDKHLRLKWLGRP